MILASFWNDFGMILKLFKARARIPPGLVYWLVGWLTCWVGGLIGFMASWLDILTTSSEKDFEIFRNLYKRTNRTIYVQFASRKLHKNHPKSFKMQAKSTKNCTRNNKNGFLDDFRHQVALRSALDRSGAFGVMRFLRFLTRKWRQNGRF